MGSSCALCVCITGAAGQIGTSLALQMGKGDVFGRDQPVLLQLLDVTPCLETLQGVVMELQDCALPLLQEIVCTDDPLVAFRDVDAVFLVGSVPHRVGMSRRDLLADNVKIFQAQGKALDAVAKKSVKILMVANPANTLALVCSRFAPSIPPENFSALTRLDQNRAQAQLAGHLGVEVADVTNCIVWGNHSDTQYPDAGHARVRRDGQTVSAPDAVSDEKYLRGEFITTVQQRVNAIIRAKKRCSGMSAAKAACDHMHDWFHGTRPDQFVSMAVVSDGSYGTPPGVFFSFPVTIEDRRWTIVQGLSVDQFSRQKLDITGADLCAERDDALAACQV